MPVDDLHSTAGATANLEPASIRLTFEGVTLESGTFLFCLCFCLLPVTMVCLTSFVLGSLVDFVSLGLLLWFSFLSTCCLAFAYGAMASRHGLRVSCDILASMHACFELVSLV